MNYILLHLTYLDYILLHFITFCYTLQHWTTFDYILLQFTKLDYILQYWTTLTYIYNILLHITKLDYIWIQSTTIYNSLLLSTTCTRILENTFLVACFSGVQVVSCELHLFFSFLARFLVVLHSTVVNYDSIQVLFNHLWKRLNLFIWTVCLLAVRKNNNLSLFCWSVF